MFLDSYRLRKQSFIIMTPSPGDAGRLVQGLSKEMRKVNPYLSTPELIGANQ